MLPTYDQSDKNSIEAFAQNIVGKSLSQVIGAAGAQLQRKGKGGLGQCVEELFFKITPGNLSRPDFPDAGVELKTFPLKTLKKGGLVAKERISLGMIDYMGLVEERWEESSFLKKNALLLLLAYLHEVNNASFMDHVFQFAKLWDFPPEDLKIIRDDWDKILSRVKAGEAHLLSEGDTLYLGAATKSQDSGNLRPQPYGPDAKPRTFSLKQQYVNVIVRRVLGEKIETEKAVKGLGEYQKGETFEGFVARKFEPFIGKSIDEIHGIFGKKFNPSAKNFTDQITKAILDVKGKNIEEFEKADLVVRTVRLRPNGIPPEDVSSPYFHYKELAAQKWESSDWKAFLERRFFFVVFQYDAKKVLRLKKVKFWTMPTEILENQVRMVWEETVRRINSKNSENLPKKSENEFTHVRPHGRDGSDTDETPEGKQVVKKCFWLNKEFVASELEK